MAERGKRSHATIWRAANLLLGQPVITVDLLAQQLNTSFPSANNAVAELVEIGVLRPTNEKRHRRLFHAHEVMNALLTGMDNVLDDVARLTSVPAAPAGDGAEPI